MPTYEYECKSCSHSFEVFQSMSDPPLKDCPECGKEVRRLIFGGTGVIFKGSGFYVTDKGKTETKAASSQKTETAAGGDSASKSDSAKGNSAPGAAPGSSISQGSSVKSDAQGSAEKAKPETKTV